MPRSRVALVLLLAVVIAVAGRGTPEAAAAAPAVAVASAPGNGWWVADADGRVTAGNGAPHHGDLAGVPLQRPIVGMTGTPTGRGYWLVAADGGIFAFGDAGFHGSTGSIALNQPVVGMAATATGRGYWLAARDGGVFAFGDAPFAGSAGGGSLPDPAVAMTPTPDGDGYRLVTAGGWVLTYRAGGTPDTPPPPTVPPPPPTGDGPTVGPCPVLPADNPWNQDVRSLAVHPDSGRWIDRLGGDRTLHPDFGADWDGGPFGIPYVVVGAEQPDVPITFTAYGDESDPGPYPVPPDAPIEGGADSDGDRHVLVVDTGSCTLYELYRAFPNGEGWDADSGAVWDLRSNGLRPEGWTSADAAGLPIFPGLARYDEVAAGEIRHALRFTAQCTQRGYIHPATHQAGIEDESCPPMGARFRLRADADISGFTGQARVVLEALRTYGMIVADNGGSWFISGAPDARWDDDDLGQLKDVPASWFEALDTGPIVR